MARLITLMTISFFIFNTEFTWSQSLHIVEATNFEFNPADISIAVGDTVEWQWITGIHTTTSDSTTGQNVWDAPLDASNQTFRFVITSPGVHNYHCTPHLALGMVGTITATVSSVNNENQLPKKFNLGQNYPNPFNPSTVINYQLPVSGNVTLKVYDILGKEVATLVDEYHPAGNYDVEFNAAELTNGIYFYKLQAEKYSETKKMILLR
jgi:plastocyanin